ncbi:MAG TPA: O-antigen polymerase [Patescibacteria group bacterium]|nr:O-antigen polymerase [Patescibacteria group bacterium]
MLLFFAFLILAVYFFYLFARSRTHNPLWLMLSAWSLGIGIPRLHLSPLEIALPLKFRLLILISLISFALGFFLFNKLWKKYPWWVKFSVLVRQGVSVRRLRYVIYLVFGLSLVGLYLFYKKAGNFPLLAPDSDAFRFAADTEVPGLINYTAQFARLFIPLSFFVMFWEGFSFKKHWDLLLLSVLGTVSLTVFASRTQIFFIDLWVMALYLVIRKPTWRQAFKFYPFFLIISVVVLGAVPAVRNYKSYGTSNYLAGVTQIDTTHYAKGSSYLVPIYVGVSFNMQALLHAQMYYETHPLQHGKVSLDPFTNLFGKALPILNKLKSQYDLGAIFYSWWNTGTYLFPFVQDFGEAAFFFAPFVIAGLIALAWRYWRSSPNYLSINLYAYTCFFIVMTIYLSFTVRAEFYLDLAFLLLTHIYVSTKQRT